jgi:sodium/proline symporter
MSMALNPESSILDLVSYAWAGFGAAFGPVMLFSLFWNKMGKESALAGMVTGTVTVLVWKQLEGGIFELYELLPAFVAASLSVWIFGRLFPASQAVEAAFETSQTEYKGML